jgi:serine/threonine protein kinase
LTARSRRGAPPLNADGSTVDPPPATCGPFRILHQVGAGSLGPVFRAHDPTRDRLVALKIFRLDVTPEQSAQLASALEDLVADQPQHPAIAAALAAGVEGSAAYFAQEYVNGDALDASLRQHGPPPIESVIVTLSRLAEALDRAAGEGIHHGALHPRDLLLGGGGDVRLIDLGVAQALQRAGLRAPVRRPYSAPERVDGRPWGGPADIFALGAIVYEMITGRRVTGPGVPVVTADGVSGLDTAALADVLGRALNPDPGSRFASASDLEDTLRPILARGRRAVLAPRRSRPARPEGTVPLPLDAEAPAPLEPFDLDVRLSPTIAASPVDLPLAHADGAGSGDTDRYRDVLAESADAPFSSEAAPPPAPVQTPAPPPLAPPSPRAAAPEAVSRPADTSKAERPEPSPPPIPEPPPLIDQDVIDEMADRPAGDRAPLSSWSMANPPAAERRSLLVPLLVAMCLGLAGGFGLGYWTAWRAALRAPASAVATAPTATETPTSESRVPASAPPSTPASTPAASSHQASPAPARPAPAPAPAPESARPGREAAKPVGRLVIRSSPSRAQVRLDGKVRGRTPLVLRNLPLRVVRVTIERAGYKADERRVALSASHPTVTLDAKLTKQAAAAPPQATTGSLVIESRPTGAQAFVDGRSVGVTPVSVPDVAPGQHRVRLELAGFTPWVTTTAVKAGERARVAASLEQGQSQ